MKVLLVLMALGLACVTYSQENVDQLNQAIPQVQIQRKLANENDLDQWKNKLDVGANVSIGSSQNVVGQDNGDTNTVGLNIDGSFNKATKKYEVQNGLALKAAATKTPAIPEYVKSADEFKYEMTYLHFLEEKSWLGPYAKVSVATSLFTGEDVRSEAVTYKVTKQDGTIESLANSKRLYLTDAYKPLTTKESVGLFMNFVKDESTKIVARVGFGAVQVSADNQFVIKDDSATPEIEVEEVKSYDDIGAEVAFNFDHQIDEKSKVFFSFEVLTPFSKDKTETRNVLELSTIEAKAGWTNKIYSWMNLKYETKAIKQPQIVDKYQVQHMLVLNFNYSLF